MVIILITAARNDMDSYNKINNLETEFTYNELFTICRRLYDESSKLKKMFPSLRRPFILNKNII